MKQNTCECCGRPKSLKGLEGWASVHPNWVEKLCQSRNRDVLIVYDEVGRSVSGKRFTRWKMIMVEDTVVVLKGRFVFTSLDDAKEARRSIYKSAGRHVNMYD